MKSFRKGKIELFNTDCVELMKQYPDKHFDIAIVDPPYGIGAFWMKQKNKYHFGDLDWNDAAPGQEYFDQLFRVSKEQIIWGGNYFSEFLPPTNAWIFWYKGVDVDLINMSEGELAWTSFRKPMRQVFIPWSGGRKGKETGIKTIHPCQRPVGLHEWTLQKYAEPGFKVIDTHGGSFSSAIAAYYFGCELVGAEISEKYFDEAVERFDKETRQIKLL